jgi:glycosyltransferase involved in cell wall biosynthesis
MRIIGVPSLPLAGEKLSASVLAAARTLIDPRADIVHFQHVSSGWAAWLARSRGQRCVLHVHSVAEKSPQWGPTGSTVLRVMEAMSIRSCDAIAAVSPAIRDHLMRRYGREVSVIPPGVEIKPPLPPVEIARWGLTRGSYCLYAGRLSPEKGLDLLIKAYRALGGPVKLAIAGDSRDGSYKARLAALAGEDPRIVFTGLVGGRALQELYSNARLFVLPSLLEGLSLALLEAMSFGLPCLASDIPENLYALDNAGFAFRSGSVQGLAERLDWLLANPGQCAATGAAARVLVARRYDWEAITDSFESLYGLPRARQAA